MTAALTGEEGHDRVDGPSAGRSAGSGSVGPVRAGGTAGPRPKGPYNNALMKPYEWARDLSMYQHIKKARDEGCLLYGFGQFHYNRLKNLLAAEGIAHTTVGEFLEEQKESYP